MADLLRTPLHDEHVAAGAKLVPFAGYEMPVQYTGLMEEHHAVRKAAGLFDVSHMGEFHLRGPGGGAFLDHVTPSRMSELPVGKAQYSCLTTEKGTFVDDILVYHIGEEHFLVVVNASNMEKDLAWLQSHVGAFDCELEDATARTALLALQGPLARRLLSELADFDGMAVKYYRVVEGQVAGCRAICSRTGYTGELGWEIFLAPEDAPKVWRAILDAGRERGVLPAGLGARDSLRLEAALPLYGNDIDEETTVLEAGLEFTIDWDKPDFIGRAALAAQRDAGVERRRVGFEITGRGIARHGHGVLVGGEAVGLVGSGSYSPTLEKAIGMTYLPASQVEPGQEIEIDVRGRRLPAVVTAMPFYRRPKPKKKKA